MKSRLARYAPPILHLLLALALTATWWRAAGAATSDAIAEAAAPAPSTNAALSRVTVESAPPMGEPVVASGESGSSRLRLNFHGAPLDLVLDHLSDAQRMLQIVSALDSSIAAVSSLKVFQLHYADAKQLATEVQQLFAPESSAQRGGGAGLRGQLFNLFRGGLGGPGGAGNASAGGGANVAGTKVTATADEYSNSLVVSAAPELMDTIESMVKEIDKPTTDITELRWFHLQHADPQDVYQILQDLFNRNNTMRANNTSSGSLLGQQNPLTQRETQTLTSGTTSSLFGGGPTGVGLGGNSSF